MKASASLVVVAIGAGASVLASQTAPPPGAQVQTFRSTTDVVLVDVSVRADGRAVTGLTASDFTLTDNGVRQKIETVEPESVPIDVTLVVDVSGNQRRPWVPREPPAKVLAALEKEVREIAAMLRATDRIRLIVADTYVQQAWPWQTGRELPPLRGLATNGLAPLHDALAAALLQPVEPARRHVVIAETKGIDSISTVTPDEVRLIAERSDAQLHLVMMEGAFDADAERVQFQCANMGLCWATSRPWTPFIRPVIGRAPVHELLPDGLTLSRAAAATTGELHKAGGFTRPSLVGTFKQSFEDFQTGYLLRYTPTAVERTGWHKIEVRVPRDRSYSVRARPGYGVEPAWTPPAPAPLPAELQTLTDLMRAYGQGAYQPVMATLRRTTEPARLLQEFVKGGNPWPATPRREAAFAIEVAEPSVFSPLRAVHTEAYAVLERFTRLVRHPLEPDEFERRWHEAVLTLLQGTGRPAITETFVERALARFPDDPQFVLVRAIAADQRSATMGQSPAAVIQLPLSLAQTSQIAQRYDEAIRWPAVATEARIRKGWLLYRTGRLIEALALLESSGAQGGRDPSLRFLDHLFRGHVLVALNRADAAIAAYRAALTIGPNAQSARVALMNVLLARGDRQEAEALAERIQVDQPTNLDPLWMYWQGRYRDYPLAIARVRELIK